MSTDVRPTPAHGGPGRTAPEVPPPPRTGPLVALVAGREVLAQVRTRSFQVSTVILLLVVLAGVVLPSLLGGRFGGDTRVAVVAGAGAALEGREGFETVPADDADEARQLVRDEGVDAAVLPAPAASSGEGTGADVLVVARTEAPTALVEALSVTPEVELTDPDATPEALRFLVPFAFGLVFFMAALGSGTMIAQNTVQEKQTRVVEILLAAVPARVLMAGKILGNAALAIGQVAAIAAVAVVGLVVTGQDDLLTLVGAPVAWFVGFFVLGFALLAAIYAASASLVSRLEDVGSVLQPVTWLVMLPYFGVVFFSSNATVMTVLSYIPFSAPVAMPVRLFFGDAAWWEPLLALVLLAASTVVVVLVAARIYTRSLLRTGTRVRLRSALRERD
ncbi:ABC transporter permease [Cellulomonas marina]|uniref:ABC-2 type transport system permease protein n=1 Tax=Cellulomonas marina TaxID=988821 RepID=A0A1I0YTI4_9CELL|nr:ABC transporter permease [Cellulomonas marina]GIG27563.1 ABC transporter permease [Cellulomonas marina]SFB15730.1 ABC-2 type transport system permease protein [Cellulomonas marina]